MPIITISRGTFSGGQALAEALAERLGYPCVSRESLVALAPTAAGIAADGRDGVMETRPPFWERLADQRTIHLTYVRAALCGRALKGNLVFHGYVGHLLLPGVSHVLGVRAIADMSYRVKAAMRQHGLSRKDAVEYLERLDEDRAEWTGFIFGVQWDDPYLYDAVLNLSRMSVASACEVVLRMAEQKEFQPTARSLKALQDLALATRVTVALFEDARTSTSVLKVTADAGVVTISGTAGKAVADAVPLVAGQVEGAGEVRASVETRGTPRG